MEYTKASKRSSDVSDNAADASSDAGSNGGSSSGGAKITKTSRMRFLTHQGILAKRSPISSSSISMEAATDRSSPSDTAPENETQIERKRRLNRNNERKKRAKRILKIEDLTSKFHSLTSENETLKTQNKDLRARIQFVKDYMKQGDRKPPASVRAPAALRQDQAQAQLQLPSSPPSSWIGSSSSRTLTIEALASSTCSLHVSRAADINGAPASGPPVTKHPGLPDLTAAAAAIVPAPARGQMTTSTGISDTSLSLMSREERMLLLQREFEKQDRIIKQLRLFAGVGGRHQEIAIPAPSAAPPQLSSGFPRLSRMYQQHAAPRPPPPLATTASLSILGSVVPAATTSTSNVSLQSLLSQHQVFLALETIDRRNRGGKS